MSETILTPAATQENKREELNSEKLVKRTLLYGGLAGVIGLFGYPLSIPGAGLRLEFIGLLVALAAFISGFFTGTLFGMPKRNASAGSDYSLNNSLVEISDWLTKIIVGLGLVNLQHIPQYLLKFGTYVSTASGITGQSLDVFSMCSVVYFSVFGLYIGYNYMRLVLSQRYKKADDDILAKQLQDTQEHAAQLEQTVVQKEEEKKQLILAVNKEEPVKIQGLAADSSMNDLLSKAAEKLANGKKTNPTDPQKGQWGGMSTNNNRTLFATVDELSPGAYVIDVKITSTDPIADPMKTGDTVILGIHPTFGDPPIRMLTVRDGLAMVRLYAFGSFTIGAFADEGNTELELDLANIPGVSDYFKNH